MIARDQQIIDEIKKGNNRLLEEVYCRYRNEFIAWARQNFSTREEVAKDVFQDSIVVFHQNVEKGSLTHLTSTLKTYLFQIGKHKLINANKKERRITYQNDIGLIHGQETEVAVSDENTLIRQGQIKRAIDQLPDDCQQLLKLYFYNEYDMESIAREMGYKNANTAKSKKTLCMKKLIVELNKLTKLIVL